MCNIILNFFVFISSVAIHASKICFLSLVVRETDSPFVPHKKIPFTPESTNDLAYLGITLKLRESLRKGEQTGAKTPSKGMKD